MSAQIGDAAVADITVEAAQARSTGLLHLSYRFLPSVPAPVFRLSNLMRLDLGWNELVELPAEIAQLTSLAQLWLNDNPLEVVPAEIEHCAKLQVVDLRRTRVRKLPREIGRLRALHTLDLDGTTLKPKQQAAFDKGATEGLVWHLRHRDTLKLLKIQLESDLRSGIYREVADGAHETMQIKVTRSEGGVGMWRRGGGKGERREAQSGARAGRVRGRALQSGALWG
jgi:hypothetical protein